MSIWRQDSEDTRDRRDLESLGEHLPPRGQRLGAPTTDLVRDRARRSFKTWRASVKRQHLKSCEKLVEMIDWHWEDSAADCMSENKHAFKKKRQKSYELDDVSDQQPKQESTSPKP